MEFEIIGDEPEWTDTPRALSIEEFEQIFAASRLQGVRLYRQFTRATLAVAVMAVDNIHRNKRGKDTL